MARRISALPNTFLDIHTAFKTGKPEASKEAIQSEISDLRSGVKKLTVGAAVSFFVGLGSGLCLGQQSQFTGPIILATVVATAACVGLAGGDGSRAGVLEDIVSGNFKRVHFGAKDENIPT